MRRALRQHGWSGRGNLLRYRMRRGVASHARRDRVAGKARRHLAAETAGTCDDALIT